MKSTTFKAIVIFIVSLLVITVVTQIVSVSREHSTIISNVNVATNITIYAVAYMQRQSLKCFFSKVAAKYKASLKTIMRLIAQA
ncbi:hypothetical protein C9J21_20635 [Photobacterium phosphoreum]|uniref:hypothetical protein n=1 Tax=Photobacterium phosphoreum TaxID=659 RepID=UPI000D1556F4|nr:hypothetical protein [Photobacterium phosphoreum]PSW28403.1 hypothetical protein C9J21_20635 [Photobacterium phosphoreum]